MIRNERGASLIEMALLMSFLLSLVAGAVDLGGAFNNYIVITNAAREGVRHGARLPCNSTNKALFKNAVINAAITEADGTMVALATSDVALEPDPVASACPTKGSTLKVTVSYDFPTVLGGILGMSEIPLSNSASMLFYGNDQEP